jgi:hypothetical protein
MEIGKKRARNDSSEQSLELNDSEVDEELDRLQQQVDMMKRIGDLKEKRARQQRSRQDKQSDSTVTPQPFQPLPLPTQIPANRDDSSIDKPQHIHAVISSQRLPLQNQQDILRHVPGRAPYMLNLANPGHMITQADNDRNMPAGQANRKANVSLPISDNSMQQEH